MLVSCIDVVEWEFAHIMFKLIQINVFKVVSIVARNTIATR